MGNYYLYLIGQFITCRLPIRWAYAMAVFLADVQYHFSKTDREAVANNLKVILNTPAVDSKLVKEVFRNFGRYLVDFLTMSERLNEDYMRAHVTVNHVEHINRVLGEGKGSIIISAHVGNWEMGGVVLPMMGFPSSTVALPHKDPRVNAFFNSQREAFGSMVIPTTVAVRRCMEHLKKNRLVAMLVERDFGNHGLLMDFLGKPTMLPKGAAIFSLKTGAPLVPCFFMRRHDDFFQIDFYPPIYPPKVEGEITEAMVRDMIKQYVPMMEDYIRKYPTQWLMFREFWAK